MGGWFFLAPYGFAGSLRGAVACALVDAADHIGYEWTGRAHGSLADALATLAVQRWLEQWLVAE